MPNATSVSGMPARALAAIGRPPRARAIAPRAPASIAVTGCRVRERKHRHEADVEAAVWSLGAETERRECRAEGKLRRIVRTEQHLGQRERPLRDRRIGGVKQEARDLRLATRRPFG